MLSREDALRIEQGSCFLHVIHSENPSERHPPATNEYQYRFMFQGTRFLMGCHKSLQKNARKRARPPRPTTTRRDCDLRFRHLCPSRSKPGGYAQVSHFMTDRTSLRVIFRNPIRHRGEYFKSERGLITLCTLCRNNLDVFPYRW